MKYNEYFPFQNSARRYSQFVQYFKPVLGKALTIKGLYPPPPTTTTTTTTEASTTRSTTTTESSNDDATTAESNEI